LASRLRAAGRAGLTRRRVDRRSRIGMAGRQWQRAGRRRRRGEEQMTMLERTLAVTRKEFLHIRRDPRTLVIIFFIPIVQLVLLGYASTTDIKHLRTAVLDADRTSESRGLVAAYRASNYFEITTYVNDEAELAALVDAGTVRAGMIVPEGFGDDIAARRKGQVAFVIDGSDPNVANTVLSASQAIGQAYSVQLALKATGGIQVSAPGVDVRPRVWYNPELKSANFMIPGLMGMILAFLATMLTALSVVRERELGTLEQLVVTPIRPIELVVGKVIPYIGVAYFAVLEVLVIGLLWFRVPVHGNVALLLALAGLFLFTSLGQGLLISTVARTQQEAMLLSWFTILPSIFLAGFFFPIEAMPAPLRFLSIFVPLRYLLVILRGIILKGVGMSVLWDEVLALSIFGLVVVGLAAVRFRKQLD
jgi:ABC-2 type transport system permease protein